MTTPSNDPARHAATGLDLPTDADVAAYRERGFHVSGRIIPDALLDAAERGMRRFYAGERDRPGPAGVEDDGWRREHGGGLRKNDYASLRIDELDRLVRHSPIAAVAARLSGAAGIRLWHDQLLFKPPDASDANVGWHTDRQYWTSCTSEEMLTAWVPVHDVDETSGSIAFVPGSHRTDVEGLDFFDQDLGRLEAAAEPAILLRGQVSFHHCRTIHGSGPNRSAWPRRSLAIHLQPADNRHRGGRHRNDDLCGRTAGGTPDYADPALFPVLWPA